RVADLERVGGADAIPAGLVQDFANRVALGRQRGATRDVLERDVGRRWDGPRAGRRARDPQVGSRSGRHTIAKHDHAFDEIFELANIAGVSVLQQAIHLRPGDRIALAAKELGVALDEIVNEGGNLLEPLSERRYLN